jgi:hypothetical protein
MVAALACLEWKVRLGPVLSRSKDRLSLLGWHRSSFLHGRYAINRRLMPPSASKYKAAQKINIQNPTETFTMPPSRIPDELNHEEDRSEKCR